MDFNFTPEQLDFKKSVIDFARRELNDDIILRDKESRFSKELWKKCADFGILSLPFPKEYGGTECDIITTLFPHGGIGLRVQRQRTDFFLGNGQMWTVQMPIWHFGSPEQKQKYLPRLCGGECIGANGMTEPGSGSDAFALSTVAERKGDYYELNGMKTLISSAPISDLFLIFASTDKRKGFMGVSAFLIEKGTPGLRVGKPIEKMGLKTAPMARFFLRTAGSRSTAARPRGKWLGYFQRGHRVGAQLHARQRRGRDGEAIGDLRQIRAGTEAVQYTHREISGGFA